LSGTRLDALSGAQLSKDSADIEVDVDMRELMAQFANIAETSRVLR
jgi:hypothetical protein